MHRAKKRRGSYEQKEMRKENLSIYESHNAKIGVITRWRRGESDQTTQYSGW